MCWLPISAAAASKKSRESCGVSEPIMFENLSTIASLAALLAQVVILVASLTRTTEKAGDAKKIALEAHGKIALLRSEFALYREYVAKEYITRDLLREFEERLTKEIDRVIERIDDMADERRRRGP
jgi:hypothetical protein